MSMAAVQHETYSYYIGLEGGLEALSSPEIQSNLQGPGRRVLLESWAYVTDGSRGHFGRSGGIELPEALAQEVLHGGVELAAAIDKFSGRAGIRDGQGAWGVLSGNLITRREAFRVALVAAFAPFYNAALFHRARAAG
jgi:non-canonical (house-cleaning) NTP pyrophosphatase